MEHESRDLDQLQSTYQAAVEEWITAIREEEANDQAGEGAQAALMRLYLRSYS